MNAPRPRLDADQIRAAARGRWRDILPHLGIDRQHLVDRHSPCPGCGGADRFRFDDRNGAGTWICGGGGNLQAGDGFGLLQHCHGWGFVTALAEVARVLGLESDQVDQRPAARREPLEAAATRPVKQLTLAPEWQERWKRALPIEPDTPAARYLLGRSCRLPPKDGDLRWHPSVPYWRARPHKGPALIGLISDPRSGRPISMHFTWIAPDGSGKADLGDAPVRLTLWGHSNVGVIRLWPDQDVTLGLGIAEGTETALSAARVFEPMWSTVTASSMARLPVLPGIEALSIFADDDPAGWKAAAACARTWRESGVEVRVLRPPTERAADAA